MTRKDEKKTSGRRRTPQQQEECTCPPAAPPRGCWLTCTCGAAGSRTCGASRGRRQTTPWAVGDEVLLLILRVAQAGQRSGDLVSDADIAAGPRVAAGRVGGPRNVLLVGHSRRPGVKLVHGGRPRHMYMYMYTSRTEGCCIACIVYSDV